MQSSELMRFAIKVIEIKQTKGFRKKGLQNKDEATISAC